MRTDNPSFNLLTLKGEKEVESFIKLWCEKPPSFSEFINAAMIRNGLSLSALMKSSGINRNYGYNIINGRRIKPSRDKVIALCVAAQLTVSETQDALSIAEVGTLYYKRERDVRIAAALNEKIGSVLSLNIRLEDCGLEPLSV